MKPCKDWSGLSAYRSRFKNAKGIRCRECWALFAPARITKGLPEACPQSLCILRRKVKEQRGIANGPSY